MHLIQQLLRFMELRGVKKPNDPQSLAVLLVQEHLLQSSANACTVFTSSLWLAVVSNITIANVNGKELVLARLGN